MKQLLEASYDQETKSCHFSLLIDGELHPFIAEMEVYKLEGEDVELQVLKFSPSLSLTIPLSDQTAWRWLGFCLRVIIRTGKSLELPVDLDNPADDPGSEAIVNRYRSYR